MSYRYILYDKAQQDYEESVTWYLDRSLQSAAGFVEAIDATLELICKKPTQWRNTYKHYFELGLKKYPFTIIYSIGKEQQLIIIWKIYHYKRSSKKKYSGLKKV